MSSPKEIGNKTFEEEKRPQVFKIMAASFPGYSHRVRGQNNQDRIYTHPEHLEESSRKIHGVQVSISDREAEGDYRFIAAVLSDGCGSSRDSEIGSKLTTQFLTQRIEFMLRQKEKITEEDLISVCDDLYPSLIDHLANYLSILPTPNHDEIIMTQLLATVIGVIVTQEWTCIFNAGDGLTYLNGEVSYTDEQNTPSYPAYHLRSASSNNLPDKFKVTMIKTTNLIDLRIATDWCTPNKEGTNLEYQLFTAPALHTFPDIGLSEWLYNLTNRPQYKNKNFADDTTLFIIHRTQQP